MHINYEKQQIKIILLLNTKRNPNIVFTDEENWVIKCYIINFEVSSMNQKEKVSLKLLCKSRECVQWHVTHCVIEKTG